jgi:LemA protein
MAIYIVIALVGFLIFWAIGVNNKLVALRQRLKNAYAQIDVQLQRRFELIPNLVETAKGYMNHERETLTKVIEARNQALKVSVDIGKNPENGEKMQEYTQALSLLQQNMTKFMALAESYPDLKANTTMINLMEELTSTENKVSFSRQGYNDSVMEYNTAIEQFPASVIANNRAFKAATLLELADPEMKKAVKVSF